MKADELNEGRRKRKRKVRRALYGPGPYGMYGTDAGYSGDGGVAENVSDDFDFELDTNKDRLTVYSKTAGALEPAAGRVEFFAPDDSKPNVIEISYITVWSKYQKQGLATAMWEYLKQAGYKIITPTELTSDGKGLIKSLKTKGLAESLTPEKQERIKEFVKFCFKKLKLQKRPRIRLSNKVETTALGYFVPDTNTIVVVVKGRHGMDIMRTLAHELVHLKQSETRGLDGSTGSPDENEANAMAGVLLRVWGKLHPEYFVEERKFTDLEIAIMEGGGSIDDDRTYAIRKQLEQAWKEKQMKVNEIVESATAGATSAANVGIGIAYKNLPAAQPKGGKKTKHGKLAPNALDMKGGNLITGGSIGKQSFIKR